MKNIKHIVSFSGGRTSAYLCHLAKKKFGDDVEFVYMDTGAEHPKTYDFIRKVNNHLKLNLTCIRAKFNHGGMGRKYSNGYEVINIDNLKHDNYAYNEHMKKYGKSTAQTAWCTRDMKEQTFNRYARDKYKVRPQIWLGIRADEPKRIFGDKLGKGVLRASDHPNVLTNHILTRTKGDNFDTALERDCDLAIAQRAEPKDIRFLAELSDFDKQDILDWWSDMPFDLEVEPHLGNCVFCIKKSINKIALATREEPELANTWRLSLENANKREDLQAKNPLSVSCHRGGVIYRGRHSFDSIQEHFSHLTTKELRSTIRELKNADADGSCSESCEGFSLK